MGTGVMILGDSGSGKSRSMKNMPAKSFALIKVVGKPLPFKHDQEFCKQRTTRNADEIIALLNNASKTYDVIVIDDFQYIMSLEYMDDLKNPKHSGNGVFKKFNDIAANIINIMNAISALPEEKRVYILSHTERDDFGFTKIKTVGKMIDNLIVLEGLVTVVVSCEIHDKKHYFRTRSTGNDTIKTPEEMFGVEEDKIENCLYKLDTTVCNFYQLPILGKKETNNLTQG